MENTPVIPTYLTHYAIWRDFLPVPVFSLLFSLLVFLPIFGLSKKRRPLYLVVLSSAILGITIGQITGQSREPAVGAVLPGVLGLIGGYSVFVFSSKSNTNKVIVSASIISLCLCLLVGIYWGARLRMDHEAALAGLPYRTYLQDVEHALQAQSMANAEELRILRELIDSERTAEDGD